MASIDSDFALPPPGLETRARAALVRSRLRVSASVFARAALLPIAVLLVGQPAHAGSLVFYGGAGFVLLAAALAFHGRAPGHAVGPGMLAAAAATLCPLVIRAVGQVCQSDACMSLCLPACVVGGATAGVLLGLRAKGEEDRQSALQTLVAGAALVLLAAPMGCAMLGASGLLGVVIGMVAGSAPMLIRARA